MEIKMPPKIFESILKIKADLGAIGRDRPQQNFKYRSIDDVYNHLQPLEAKHGVFTLPEVLEEDYSERTAKSGTILFHTRLKIRYTFYATDGSSLSAIVIGEGMDSGDKGANKSMSIAHKYALTQAYSIRTLELIDPDSESHEVVDKREFTHTIHAISTDQADSVGPHIKISKGEHTVTFGKYKGQTFSQMGKDTVAQYCRWLQDDAKAKNKPLGGNAKDLVDAARRWFVDVSNYDKSRDITEEQPPFERFSFEDDLPPDAA
jgi:hypothetical protein